jgi:hypothetical protein
MLGLIFSVVDIAYIGRVLVANVMGEYFRHSPGQADLLNIRLSGRLELSTESDW